MDALFGKTRKAVLEALFLSPGKKWHMRELARRAGVSATMLGKEATSLCAAGIAIGTTDGNRRLVWANPHCPIFEELTALARASTRAAGPAESSPAFPAVAAEGGRGGANARPHPVPPPPAGPTRKSRRLGLSAPYDWSSRDMPDDVLILKVLERHDFRDVVKICSHYGLPMVRGVFRNRLAQSPAAETLVRMLSNIESGLVRARAGNVAPA